MNDRDVRLRQFFGGYFNQDWDIGGASSWRDVVVQYVKENPRESVLVLRDDLRAWLQDTASGGHLSEGLPAGLGCDYDSQPEGLSGIEWVQQLADFMERQLEN